MAGLCITSVRKGGAGCDHRALSVTMDGVPLAVDISEAELDALPWNAETQRQLVVLGLKRLRVLGLALDNAAGRVTNGEEATNVKQYLLLAKDVTKSNIGTAYVNVPIGLNGERSLVEFTGCTQFRLILNMNAIGTGAWGARVVRDSDNAVLFENAAITGAGEKELDTDWQTLPAAASGLILVRLQGKSVTAADDPVFRRCVMLVR
jgi:hypothetical protein